MSFIPKKSLINPNFEGYRLSLIPQKEAVSRYVLPHKTTQATTSGKFPLSFQEMQSRITHNHLAIDGESNQALYVDIDHKVVLIQFDTEEPSFRVVYEMHTPIQSESTAYHREYPSAMFLGPTLALASDGAGLLHLLSNKGQSAFEAVGIYHLPQENEHRPFQLHYCHRESPVSAIAVVSSKVPTSAFRDGSDPAKTRQSQSAFDIWAVKINLLSLRPGSSPTPLHCVWHRRGEDIPISGTFQPEFNSHLLIGETVYTEPNVPIQTPCEPTSDEIAPIPRANENLDKPDRSDAPQKPPPYSWTQTPDSVVVAIPLPSATAKNNIRVLFSAKTITVHVDYQASTAIPIPRYSAEALWDVISPSSCLWTWDKSAEHSYGVLTLHLEKQHEGTRWMHVFASAGEAGSNASNDDADNDVPETLDPSELYQIREALEKYTASLRDGSDASGLGLGTGVPSLASGEIDDEVDLSVGRNVKLTWVAADGSNPIWFKPTEQIPFQLLATILPGVGIPQLPLVIKHNLDGLVFGLRSSSPTEGPSWIHESTFPAIAFVLASKRDARFTYTVPNKAILSFEGMGRNRGGNIYIYRPAGPMDKWAKQSILRIDNDGEALLGVGGVVNGAGEFVVVCLLEGTLVIVREI